MGSSACTLPFALCPRLDQGLANFLSKATFLGFAARHLCQNLTLPVGEVAAWLSDHKTLFTKASGLLARGPSSADHRPKLCSPQVPAWSLFKRYLLRRLFLVILLKSSRRHSVPRPPLFLRSIYHFWISLFIFSVLCFPSSDRGQRLRSALFMTSPRHAAGAQRISLGSTRLCMCACRPAMRAPHTSGRGKAPKVSQVTRPAPCSWGRCVQNHLTLWLFFFFFLLVVDFF